MTRPPRKRLDTPEELFASDTPLSEADWDRLRAHAKRNLYFFAKVVLGYKDLTPRAHRDLCDFLGSDGTRKLALMPRGHFKTTLATIADPIRRLACNPQESILLVNESAENAEYFLAEIKEHFMNNERLRLFFPEIVPDDFNRIKWNKGSITVPRQGAHREPSIDTIGIGGKVVSRHYSMIINDDILADEAMHSPTVMRKTNDFMNREVSLLSDPKNDTIHVIGTRWAFSDTYSHIMENMPQFETFIRKAIVMGEDGPEPLFKERFTMEMFQNIIENDPEQWATQYSNDPYDVATADFRKQWLQFYRVTTDNALRWEDAEGSLHIQEPQKLRIYVHVDPSMGESIQADHSAVVVVGINSRDDVFILDTWRRRIDPLGLIDKILRVCDHFKPKLVSIESNAYQKSLKYYLEDEARRRETYVRVEPYRASSKRSKEARIRGALQPYFSTGQMYLKKGMTDFVDEYLSFPRGDHEHLLDALAQGPSFWRAPKDDIALKRFKRLQKEIQPDLGVTGYGI